jgi:disulfide oxidoreductase YuzD
MRITDYYLRMRYGEAVQVEYVDLAEAENQARYQELSTVVAERSLPYPLVAVNGQLRLAGSAHYFQVLPVVDEALRAPGMASAETA